MLKFRDERAVKSGVEGPWADIPKDPHPVSGKYYAVSN
jgi:hypothetical protein